MNIYQKLVEVRKIVPYLQKESKSTQYNYVGSSQVLAAVRGKLDELGVLLITKILDHKLHIFTQEKADGKITNTYFTELDVLYKWVNAEKPEETIEITWYGQGIDTAGEKGVGKAVTYAEKYFLLKQFNIATDKDDPDRFQEKAQNYSKELATNDDQEELKKLALEFGELREKSIEDVYKALKISDLSKLNTHEAKKHITTVKGWISKAKE